MRAAVSRADSSDEFVNQQNFDRAVAGAGSSGSDSAGVGGMVLGQETVVAGPRWTWKKMVLNPAVLAISIAVVVIAGVFVFQLLGRLNDFPGSATARKLLTVAASTRPVMLDPVSTEAGTLSDLFFMKHGLEHYDVPDEFADFQTIGCRVFDDEESQSHRSNLAGRKTDAVFSFSGRARHQDRSRAGFSRLALCPSGRLGRCGQANRTAFALWLRSGAVRRI